MSSDFVRRHIGPGEQEQQQMLSILGFDSMSAFVDELVPDNIRRTHALNIGDGLSEDEALARLRGMAEQNKVYRSLIGQGYYQCHVPNVIARNVLENPAWYTSYTPYQPEISQGRLEALLNFQTMVSDLTAMEIANASLLDEATAAAEAMTLAKRQSKAKSDIFVVDRRVHPQTLAVIKTRARYLDIDVLVHDCCTGLPEDAFFGVLLQYPDTEGQIVDWRTLTEQAHERRAVVAVATDLLALTILTPPGEWGADIVVGSAQRFGVPVGFGGPHAAFMATRESYKRSMAGRIVGVSVDSRGKPAYRLALQTREQHIRREKATSNICTAQALLAIMAGCYAVYHGPDGLRNIAGRVHGLAVSAAEALRQSGLKVRHAVFFDTLVVDFDDAAEADAVMQRALAAKINLRRFDGRAVGCSFDERSNEAEVATVVGLFADKQVSLTDGASAWPTSLQRQSEYLSHPVFHRYHSETEMMRYLRRLADYDLALDRTMIPLGSCTMKLNAASEMQAVSWPEFADIHPFVPHDQSAGFRALFADLEAMIAEATGYHAVSLQPNSGASGEYAGLLAIIEYHKSRGEGHRHVCLIPASAHGTNPASASLAGMKVVIVGCDEHGNVDIADLRTKAAQHRDNLAAIMITYPSTHGVFEHHVREVCEIVHDAGGQVYIDGANFNALLGLASPGEFGGDVSHLNLHKTFAIPHGGGGPGVGPIGVGEHLAPFLPTHAALADSREDGHVVSAAPWGSALVCVIPWMYMRMMGSEGLKQASAVALLNANYLAKRLSDGYSVLYSDKQGHVAHECIIDTRPFKDDVGISVDDIAKRLMDFGFHAPTMSFPVPGTLMIEPTESESLAELNRFCDAMLVIRREIAQVADGQWPPDDNPLVNAPHTLADITEDWQRAYDRKTAVFPLEGMNPAKYFTPVNRVDNAYGDRHLVCSCPPLESYQD